jgi:hypothetical protein
MLKKKDIQPPKDFDVTAMNKRAKELYDKMLKKPKPKKDGDS